MKHYEKSSQLLHAYKVEILLDNYENFLIQTSAQNYDKGGGGLTPKSSNLNHRHLRNIDCLTACTNCLVCFISTVNSHSKRKRKRKEAY
jgi:hypothetical protein